MARKRRKNDARAGELNLTAMIDVAFQLLSFFIITVKPVDVFAHLSVYRPSPDAPPAKAQPESRMIRIQVFPDTYVINERPVDLRQLDGLLGKLAAIDTTQTILIMCANQSPHGKLIELLDMCAKYRLTNLSVVSSGGY